MPELSIVVPFYGVERYFAECLESIANQTFRDFEVIMVDDGSLDGCAVIAKAFAARDRRFHLVQQENQGLGPARNTGAGHASGRYLAFADSDDLVVPEAYALLVGSLRRTGSAIASGNVRRFEAGGIWPSWLPSGLFRIDRPRIHVCKEQRLLWDRSAWNKVFRRDFWDSNGFAFPAGLYEDVPVTMAAHVAAETVDVVGAVVYHYRFRAGSITERRRELENIEWRLSGLHRVADFFDRAAPELRDAFDRTVLDGDLPVVLGALRETDAEAPRLVEMMGGYLDRVDPAVLDGLGPKRRLAYHLARRRLTGELIEAQRAESRGVIRRGRVRPRWYHDLPYRGDREVGLPDSVHRAEQELTLVARADRIGWRDGVLTIEAHAYVDLLDMGESSTLRAWLQHTGNGSRIDLDVQRVARPDVTADSGQDNASYEWSGFRAELDLGRLRRRGRWEAGNWELRVSVSCAGVRRDGAVRASRDARTRWPAARQVAAEWWAQPVFTEGGPFQVRVRRPKAVLTGIRVVGDAWVAEGRVWSGSHPAELVASRRRDRAVARFPLVYGEDGAFQVSFTLPVEGTGAEWSLSADTLRLAAAAPLTGGQRCGSRELAVQVTRYGNVNLVEREHRPRAISASVRAGGTLVVTGAGAGGDGSFLLRRRPVGPDVEVPVEWSQGAFTAVIGPGPGLPLRGGKWDLLTGDGRPVLMDRAGLAALPGPYTHQGREYDLCVYQGEALRLKVAPAFAPGERGPHAQRRLQEHDYPAMRTLPLRDLVVFESWDGSRCADSPRALCEALGDRGLERVWVSRDGQFDVPPGARCVQRDSRAHYEAMARARYVVGNCTQPRWYRKREGQVYLQTWHGTPLKRIGFDVPQMRSAEGAAYLGRLAEDVAKWDFLISPNPFSTPILRRAFRYEGEILEYGYPRNDLLNAPDSEQVAERVRARLGLPADRKVVLYAPTWRDDDHMKGQYRFDLRLDLVQARRELGDDHVLLVRGHNNVAFGLPGSDGFVIDVTLHPDITELYLVADVLITDYSSAMFDFAVTGRPIIFFTYDLENYRDRLRGFYFDLGQQAPGPLVRTSDEVLEAVRDLDRVAAVHADRYRAFTARFCPLDDGAATARVIDRIFQS